MDAYDLHESRLIAEEISVSAADALILAQSTVTPASRVRTVVAARYFPNVDETTVVWWGKTTRSGAVVPITTPISILLGQLIMFPIVTEGMELKLYPGEYLVVRRQAGTVGSWMNMLVQFIEADLPYYAYEEPLKKVVKTSVKHGQVFRSSGGISQVAPGGGSPGESSPGGNIGGGGEPVI